LKEKIHKVIFERLQKNKRIQEGDWFIAMAPLLKRLSDHTFLLVLEQGKRIAKKAELVGLV
jgi:hypothetical protein